MIMIPFTYLDRGRSSHILKKVWQSRVLEQRIGYAPSYRISQLYLYLTPSPVRARQKLRRVLYARIVTPENVDYVVVGDAFSM